MAYYIRADRYHPRVAQMATIMAHGRTRENIYVEGENDETWFTAVAHLDKGEALGVCGVHRVSTTWTAIVRRLDHMHGRGLYLFDLERGVLIDPGSAAAVLDAKRVVEGIARMPSPEIAAERGRKGGKVSRRGGWASYTPEWRKQVREIWERSRTASEAALAIGVSRRTLYRFVQQGHLPSRPSED